MPITTDPVFGVLYLEAADFLSAKEIFGVGSSVPQDLTILRSFLAAASRWIDAKTCKTFIPDANHVETHTINPTTGRINVNNPPVLSVSSFKIITGPSSFSTVPTTSLLINNQESWVEVLIQPFVFPRMSDLLVQITYKSNIDVKQNIKLATGYVAATMMSDASTAAKFPSGIKSIKIGSQAQIVKAEAEKGGNDKNSRTLDFLVPSIVSLLLANDVAIGVA